MRDGLVVSAADGRISSIEKVVPPAELGLGTEPRVRISTFLSIFDVHIQRSPVPGRIVRSVYIPGAFLNAALDKASEENERRAIVVEMPGGGEVGVVQIAGLVARRIVTFSREGDSVAAGQRFGLSASGSRVDVFLPPGAHGAGQRRSACDRRRDGFRRFEIARAGARSPPRIVRWGARALADGATASNARKTGG